MAAKPSRTPPSRTGFEPGRAAAPRARPADLQVVSDLSPDMPITQRELDLIALLLGDRLREILEDDS